MTRLQELVIRSSPWPPLRWAYAAVSRMALMWLVARLRRVPEIRALDLRPPGTGHCYGSSDFDLRAETVPLDPDAFFALADRLADVLAPGGTWRRMFDLYLFPEAEFELQRRVIARSNVRGRRWVRLLGQRPIPPEPATLGGDAALGRATYDYGGMCQDLLQSPHDLHRTRLLYGRAVRIDRELRAQAPDAPVAREPLAREVLAAAHDPVARGRVRAVPFAALARAHALALAETTALAETLPPPDGASEPAIAVVADATPPDTRDAAVEHCREAVAELCASLGGAIESAVLGAVPGCRYEYRTYLILRDGISVDEHLAVCAATRGLFVAGNRRLGYVYARVRHPTLLTRRLWRAAGRWYHALRPVEEHFFLVRHGVVLWGEDRRDELVAPGRAAVLESAAVATADLRNRIWGATRHRQMRQLVDLITGRVPALWLVLARGVVATSPAEAVAAAAESAMPHADVIAALHARVTGADPQHLPELADGVWQPAMAAMTDWLALLPELALDAVRATARR